MSNYVAILPDGKEFFGEIPDKPDRIDRHRHFDRELCENAVRKSGLMATRRNPVNVKIPLYRFQITNGEMKRVFVGTYEITPPLEPMTTPEYEEEMEEICSDIPEEFHPFIRSESWDRGHSAGMEECVSIARDLVYALKPCIARNLVYALKPRHQTTPVGWDKIET